MGELGLQQTPAFDSHLDTTARPLKWGQWCQCAKLQLSPERQDSYTAGDHEVDLGVLRKNIPRLPPPAAERVLGLHLWQSRQFESLKK